MTFHNVGIQSSLLCSEFQNSFRIHSILLYWFMTIHLLTATRLTPGGSSTVHIYTQTIRKHHNETEYTEQHLHNNKNT